MKVDEGRGFNEIVKELGICKQMLAWLIQDPEWPEEDFIVGRRPAGTRKFGRRDQETAVWLVRDIGLHVEHVGWLYNRTSRCIYQWKKRFPNPRPPDNVEELLDGLVED